MKLIYTVHEAANNCTSPGRVTASAIGFAAAKKVDKQIEMSKKTQRGKKCFEGS
jgi:hypothetical protein